MTTVQIFALIVLPAAVAAFGIGVGLYARQYGRHGATPRRHPGPAE